MLDPSCVPVRISINKLKSDTGRSHGVFRKGGGPGTGESYIAVVFSDSLLHRPLCFPYVDFAALEGNPVDNVTLFSRVNGVLWSQ